MPADLVHDRELITDTALTSPQSCPSLRLSRSNSNAPVPPATSRASSSSLADALGPQPLGSSSQLRATSHHSPDTETEAQISSLPSKRTRADVPAEQPLTTHGKPRERVYLACLQCRNRKVRCDGNKPECFNCTKRADPNLGQCSYDAAPRRRGKDRTPGSRKLAPYEQKKTRTTRSRLEEEAKRKKAEATARPPQPADPFNSRSVQAPATTQPEPGPSMPIPSYSSAPRRMTIIEAAVPLGWQSPEDLFDTPNLPDLLYAHPGALELTRRIEEEEELPESDSYIVTPPSVQFSRQTWWDALLSFYASHPSRCSPPVSSYGAPLTPAVREEATARVAADLRCVFHVSLHWFSFIHVPRFFGSLFDPYRRQALQPSLVLALLALGTFFQSSELELGANGRARALHLLDQAHATFQASLSSGWIDIGLVQTAWLLALFEMQAHPKCATPRTRSAFAMLDSLIRSLHLTTLDISDPRTTIFVPGVVPVVPPTSSSPPASFERVSNPTLPLPEGTCRLSIPQPDPILPSPEGNCRLTIPQPGPIHPHPRGTYALNIPHHVPVLDIPQPDPFLPVPVGAIPQSHPVQTPHTYPPPTQSGEYTPLWQTASYDQNHTRWDCRCSAYSLIADWPQAEQLTPAWRNMPMWPREVSEGELQKEECRRLVWCTVILSVAHNTKTAAGTDQDQQHLWIKDPANYALLFPGESFATADPSMPRIPASKDSVWALYMRTLFLWNSCLRARSNKTLSNADRAQFAMTAWLELDTVEAAMDKHTCDIQSGFMLQMREVLFNTRMVVSNEFRRYIPEALTENGQALYRAKARRWMTHMLNLAKAFRECQVISAQGEPTENSRRCMLLYWFMSQIMRALGLWHADRSLTVALEVAKAFAPCVEFMMLIWPSPGQRKEYEGLRNWLVRSCHSAGVPPPQRVIAPLKTDLVPPPAPAAASAVPQHSSSHQIPSQIHLSLNPSIATSGNPSQPPLPLGPDPFGLAADQMVASYHPTQPVEPQQFHPAAQLQPDFHPPFW
ncbi:hypothetical protein K466DRAFT_552028 [Polyporus arcularius HHB13444]|uniref:Zn(2)-C6 fungal-type domain-containing protein n=1 Tax=Polyporus arcularius HHB13444 TaxID=1314778 RepID=A0A5C3P746_9APHY|nr:hypothetical protein K466DRAFT_552028 [Polyporus arcularius HHB13444]